MASSIVAAILCMVIASQDITSAAADSSITSGSVSYPWPEPPHEVLPKMDGSASTSVQPGLSTANETLVAESSLPQIPEPKAPLVPSLPPTVMSSLLQIPEPKVPRVPSLPEVLPTKADGLSNARSEFSNGIAAAELGVPSVPVPQPKLQQVPLPHEVLPNVVGSASTSLQPGFLSVVEPPAAGSSLPQIPEPKVPHVPSLLEVLPTKVDGSSNGQGPEFSSEIPSAESSLPSVPVPQPKLPQVPLPHEVLPNTVGSASTSLQPGFLSVVEPPAAGSGLPQIPEPKVPRVPSLLEVLPTKVDSPSNAQGSGFSGVPPSTVPVTETSKDASAVPNDFNCLLDANIAFDAGRVAGPGHWIQSDMLEVGNGMKANEDEAHFTLWCMMAFPLILGHDVRRQSPDTLRILSNTELIAVSQDSMGKPARLVGGVSSVKQLSQVYVRQLTNGDYAVALFNRNDEYSVSITLHWRDMDMPTKQPLKIRDLWKHKDVGIHFENFTTRVASHSVVALRVSQLPLTSIAQFV
eukprot:TRINITY_DN15190_c0_g2_i3.p1 TRINITY_DN15190_c0_g2~~TRINITY_DN15190_c0_g2_i3.p1  ORF type:complete len:543 (+),score=49.42 TRINITY_DN15190_c0_g2_i3:67-1629(+)